MIFDREGASLPQVLQDTKTQNGVASTTTYVYGLNGPIAETDGSGTTSYYLQDGLGSTMQLVNTSGTVTDSYTYDAFGAMTSHTGTNPQPFGYAGQQQDVGAEGGLVYLRARYYDPALGRFLTQDPLPFLQRYAYAGDDPANFSDPSGLCSLTDLSDCPNDISAPSLPYPLGPISVPDLPHPNLHFNPDIRGNWEDWYNKIRGKDTGPREAPPAGPPAPPRLPNPDDPGGFRLPPCGRIPFPRSVPCWTVFAGGLAYVFHQLGLDQLLFPPRGPVVGQHPKPQR